MSYSGGAPQPTRQAAAGACGVAGCAGRALRPRTPAAHSGRALRPRTVAEQSYILILFSFNNCMPSRRRSVALPPGLRCSHRDRRRPDDPPALRPISFRGSEPLRDRDRRRGAARMTQRRSGPSRRRASRLCGTGACGALRRTRI